MEKKIYHILLMLLVIIMATSTAFAAENITISKKMAAERCVGKRVGKIKKLYKNAGFTEVLYVKKETEKQADDRIVYGIMIDGDKDFTAGETFSSEAEVIIKYWVYNKPAPTSTPAPSPTPSPTPIPENTDPQTVLNVQQALNIFGYNCGMADGIVGQMTRDAVAAYQRDHGLESNGYLTNEFINRLNQDIDEYNRTLPTATPTPAVIERSSGGSGGSFGGSYVPSGTAGTGSYVLNWNTMKFHYPSCASVPTIAAHNREDVYLSRSEIVGMGFESCGRCHP